MLEEREQLLDLPSPRVHVTHPHNCITCSHPSVPASIIHHIGTSGSSSATTTNTTTTTTTLSPSSLIAVWMLVACLRGKLFCIYRAALSFCSSKCFDH
jgi:hypothetical protein